MLGSRLLGEDFSGMVGGLVLHQFLRRFLLTFADVVLCLVDPALTSVSECSPSFQMGVRHIGFCLYVAFSSHSVLAVLKGIALNSACCYVLINYTLLWSTD